MHARMGRLARWYCPYNPAVVDGRCHRFHLAGTWACRLCCGFTADRSKWFTGWSW